MGLFHKQSDPIAERERQLKAQIQALEGQIRSLNHEIGHAQAQPRLRSTASPGGRPVGAPTHPPQAEPAFEDAARPRSPNPFETETTPAHYNDLGVRKYDPLALVRRWLRQWRGAPPANPRLVSYLAAGSIHGLRTLRYEKRIARNRFLALCAFFVAILWGLVWFYLHNRGN